MQIRVWASGIGMVRDQDVVMGVMPLVPRLRHGHRDALLRSGRPGHDPAAAFRDRAGAQGHQQVPAGLLPRRAHDVRGHQQLPRGREVRSEVGQGRVSAARRPCPWRCSRSSRSSPTGSWWRATASARPRWWSPATPSWGCARSGSIGVPFPDVEARIVDLEKGEKEMPVGEIGELAVKGPQVMKGYWNRPEETSMVLRNGWLYTGDIAKHGQRRLLLHRGPEEGDDHRRRLQHLPAGGGGGPLRAREDQGGRLLRRARRVPG